MIIDLILDRKDGFEYDPQEFADYIKEDAEIFPDGHAPAILAAIASGCEQRVKFALCAYVLDEYNPEICDFINSVSWLPAWWDMDK